MFRGVVMAGQDYGRVYLSHALRSSRVGWLYCDISNKSNPATSRFVRVQETTGAKLDYGLA